MGEATAGGAGRGSACPPAPAPCPRALSRALRQGRSTHRRRARGRGRRGRHGGRASRGWGPGRRTGGAGGRCGGLAGVGESGGSGDKGDGCVGRPQRGCLHCAAAGGGAPPPAGCRCVCAGPPCIVYLLDRAAAIVDAKCAGRVWWGCRGSAAEGAAAGEGQPQTSRAAAPTAHPHPLSCSCQRRPRVLAGLLPPSCGGRQTRHATQRCPAAAVNCGGATSQLSQGGMQGSGQWLEGSSAGQRAASAEGAGGSVV